SCPVDRWSATLLYQESAAMHRIARNMGPSKYCTASRRRTTSSIASDARHGGAGQQHFCIRRAPPCIESLAIEEVVRRLDAVQYFDGPILRSPTEDVLDGPYHRSATQAARDNHDVAATRLLQRPTLSERASDAQDITRLETGDRFGDSTHSSDGMIQQLRRIRVRNDGNRHLPNSE